MKSTTRNAVIGAVVVTGGLGAFAYANFAERAARRAEAELAIEQSVCAKEFDLAAEAAFNETLSHQQDWAKAAAIALPRKKRVDASSLGPHLQGLHQLLLDPDVKTRLDAVAAKTSARCPAAFPDAASARSAVELTLNLSLGTR